MLIPVVNLNAILAIRDIGFIAAEATDTDPVAIHDATTVFYTLIEQCRMVKAKNCVGELLEMLPSYARNLVRDPVVRAVALSLALSLAVSVSTVKLAVVHFLSPMENSSMLYT